jgi:5-hydroxyisourate hydrolase
MTPSRFVTTHVLDTATGNPAGGMEFELARRTSTADGWDVIATGITDTDGRSPALPADGGLTAGVYCLKFATGAYFARQGKATFYPMVTVEFGIADSVAHYHVPLLISPFGYSTYRGS